MKNYKNGHSTVCLLVATLGLYFFLPPTLIALFCQWFNLNPFFLIRSWHLNPFAAARGIPIYQTVVPILVVWLSINALVAAIFFAILGLYRWLGRTKHRWTPLVRWQKGVDKKHFTIDNDSRYHLMVGKGRRIVSLCATQAGTTLLTLLPIFVASLALAFFLLLLFQATNPAFTLGFSVTMKHFSSS